MGPAGVEGISRDIFNNGDGDKKIGDGKGVEIDYHFISVGAQIRQAVSREMSNTTKSGETDVERMSVADISLARPCLSKESNVQFSSGLGIDQ